MLTAPTPVGTLAIDPATRRRLRVNGVAEPTPSGLRITVEETFGNCPKYIQRRTPGATDGGRAAAALGSSSGLDDRQRGLIRAADTFFVATAGRGGRTDVSHRGGSPGFVRVDRDTLVWPDYTGNSMYLTLGNLTFDPAAGVTFVDWASGSMLQLSGRAVVDWDPGHAADHPGALRTVVYEVESVVEIEHGVPLTWTAPEPSRFNPPAARGMSASAVQAAIDGLVASGAEVGVQVAAYRDGDLVVDAAGGVADPATGAPVTADTLFYAASTAKGIATSLAHVLVEQGGVDYDLPLVDVWPELGAHGKAGVTLRHVLLHMAGLPGLPADTTVDDLCDWDHMCGVIAGSELWWEPGTRFGYHAQTFGFLLGETLVRATGTPLRTLLRRTLTEPLGIADDVHFGVPEPLLRRVATQVAPAGAAPDPPAPGSPVARAIPAGIQPSAELANRPEVLTADIPSGGAIRRVVPRGSTPRSSGPWTGSRSCRRRAAPRWPRSRSPAWTR